MGHNLAMGVMAARVPWPGDHTGRAPQGVGELTGVPAFCPLPWLFWPHRRPVGAQSSEEPQTFLQV